MLSETQFPVKEVPAIGIPTELDSKEIDSTGHKFIVREDTGEVLSCMTDEYKFITNEKIFSYANPMIKKSEIYLSRTRLEANGLMMVVFVYCVNNGHDNAPFY